MCEVNVFFFNFRVSLDEDIIEKKEKKKEFQLQGNCIVK